jgi:lysophospholipase I
LLRAWTSRRRVWPPSLGVCRFDIKSFDFVSNEDEAGMLLTVSSVNQLISAEIDSGVDAGRIVVGGFSQGGAMSLLTGLTSERKLGGVVSLSGWTVLRNKLKAVCGIRILRNTI